MTNEIHAIKFKQWLQEWDHFDFDPEQQRKKPGEDILLFSMPAVQLRALSGVYRRQRDMTDGDGLQRLHDPKRSAAIRDFVRYGHPYSSLPVKARAEAESLKKPGWLPTAIVVNILEPSDVRRGRSVAQKDLVKVEDKGNNQAVLRLPYSNQMEEWTPQELEPFEVIDGQHRLWAFDKAIEDGSLPDDFELPVVAFTGLDIGWQAYLFWSINVSPKRINPSHAFDLFPLLRSAEWLETLSDLKIYRQARAQELTEIMFSQAESPFRDRINMLGESLKTAPKRAGVTQAGWVQAIGASFLSNGTGRSPKGLFSSNISQALGPLDWSRAQQAAFLIILWDELRAEVLSGEPAWVKKMVSPGGQGEFEANYEDAFSGPNTMLNQEQGVRGVLHVSNEIFFKFAKVKPELFEISSKITAGSNTSSQDISFAMQEFKETELHLYIKEFAVTLANFDWRSTDAPSLTEAEKRDKRIYRGGSGYVALREDLYRHLAKASDLIADIAQSIVDEISSKNA